MWACPFPHLGCSEPQRPCFGHLRPGLLCLVLERRRRVAQGALRSCRVVPGGVESAGGRRGWGARPTLFICIPINLHMSQLFISLDLVLAPPAGWILGPPRVSVIFPSRSLAVPWEAHSWVSLGCHVPHLWPDGRERPAGGDVVPVPPGGRWAVTAQLLPSRALTLLSCRRRWPGPSPGSLRVASGSSAGTARGPQSTGTS